MSEGRSIIGRRRHTDVHHPILDPFQDVERITANDLELGRFHGRLAIFMHSGLPYEILPLCLDAKAV